MPDPNLTGALRGSLELFTQNSPLAENAGDQAVDEFLDRINEDLVAGAVDKITDERLGMLVNMYRAQALRWTQEEAAKPARTSRKKSALAPDIEVDI